MAEYYSMKQDSPFKTGGSKKKMGFIIAGSIIALLIMIGIGLYFSGKLGGGDEEALREVTDGYMTCLKNGDLKGVEKYSKGNHLANLGLSSEGLIETVESFLVLVGVSEKDAKMDNAVKEEVLKTVDSILPSLSQAFVKSYEIKEVKPAPRSGTVTVKVYGLSSLDLIDTAMNATGAEQEKLLGDMLGGALEDAVGQVSEGEIIEKALEGVGEDENQPLDEMLGGALENLAGQFSRDFNVGKLISSVLTIAIKDLDTKPLKEYTLKFNITYLDDEWKITDINFV